jgi:hypothetical protein
VPKTVLAVAFAALLASPVAVTAAEEVSSDVKSSSETRVSGRGLSVYEIRPWVDGPVLGAAALGATVPILLQSRIVHKQCPCDPNEVNSFDRPVIDNHSKVAGYASHVTVALAIATPLFLDYRDLGFSDTFKEDLLVYAEVLSIDTSINNAVRYSVQRPRPEAYRENPPPTDPGSYVSFNAGHVASTVAALSAASMTYGYRYGHRVWPWAVTAVVGISEGYLRSAAGKHFYTDDIAGLFVGATVGTVVPMLHRRKGPSQWTLVPEDHGAQLVWRREF